VKAPFTKRNTVLVDAELRYGKEGTQVGERANLDAIHWLELGERGGEGSEVPTVGGKHDATETTASERADDVRDDALEGVLGDRERSREGEMVLRASHADCRREERVESIGHPACKVITE
jgi:hypothetical protein